MTTEKMPSVIDQRRLRDGAHALEVSKQAPATQGEIRRQMTVISDGLVALQSLDDLGPDANARALADADELWRRYEVLRKLLKQLEGKATSS